MNAVHGPRRLVPGSRSHVLSDRELRDMAEVDAKENGKGAIHDGLPPRPLQRSECRNDLRPCPWCAVQVAMVVLAPPADGEGEVPHGTAKSLPSIGCPACGKRVRYVPAEVTDGGTLAWHWIRYPAGSLPPSLGTETGRVYAAGLAHCRPCIRASCRWHLLLEISARGRVKVNFPEALDGDFDAMADTCALDIVDRGGASLEGVGRAMNITRERVRQIEEQAMNKMRKQGVHLDVVTAWP